MGENRGSGLKRTGKNRVSRRRTAQQQRRMRKYLRAGIIILAVLALVLTAGKLLKSARIGKGKYVENTGEDIDASRPDINVQLLTVNPYSRPGTQVNRIDGIVIHYTANPGSTAMQNRDYFEGLKDSHETKVSSNFVIGLDGEIVQCVPTWEMAYASNSRNTDTISIECCHPDETGKFDKKTYDSMVELSAWLCRKFNLEAEDVIRHYDITEKNCPKYFVEDEKAWKQFIEDIKTAI